MQDEEDMIASFFDCSTSHSHGALGCDACDEVTAKEDALTNLAMTLRSSPALAALGSKLIFQPCYVRLARLGGGKDLPVAVAAGNPGGREWRTSVVIQGEGEGQMAVADVFFAFDQGSGEWIAKSVHIERVASTKQVVASGVAPASSRFGVEYVNLKP